MPHPADIEIEAHQRSTIRVEHLYGQPWPPVFVALQITGSDMMNRMSDVVNLQDRPVYGFGQVDDILGLNSGTARRWIDGYTRSGKAYPPVIREQSSGDDLVTWGEFIETRLVTEYRDEGALVAKMRPTIELLRERLNTRYPLASARTWLRVDSREIVQEIQEEAGLDRRLALVVVRNGQSMLEWSPRVNDFRKSLQWEHEIVARLTPSLKDPNVIVDPLRSFGEPSVRGVRTEVIRELLAAGDSIDMIAELYELPEALVESALRYELRTRSTHPRQAA